MTWPIYSCLLAEYSMAYISVVFYPNTTVLYTVGKVFLSSSQWYHLVKIGLKPGNRSTWESHKCSGTQWEQFINTETNLLAWNTMRAVEELSLCPGIVEGAQNAAITEELYRRSPRRQKKRKKKLQVQPCIGWSSNYWSYGLGKKCYRVLEYYRVHI